MDIGSILRKVGGAVIKSVVPGGGIMIDVVNSLLPDDKKLPVGATGSQAQQAIESLPPDQRMSILSKELDVEIEEIKGWSNVVDSLAKADASGATTRPKIALMMARAVAFAIGIIVSLWGFAVYGKDVATLEAISEGWPFIVAILATPTALLRAYFGMRSKEKKARYGAATGQSIAGNGFSGLLRSFIKSGS